MGRSQSVFACLQDTKSGAPKGPPPCGIASPAWPPREFHDYPTLY